MEPQASYIVRISAIEDIPCDANHRCYMDLGELKPTTILRIQVLGKGDLISTAIIGAIGGGTGVHKTSHIIKSDRIVACCSDSVFCLSIPSLELLWKTKADWATCFGVYIFKNDYIVHGEMNISRIDEKGLLLWQCSGSDIFTTLEGGRFELSENLIIVKDWQNRVYKFDYSGKEVIN